AKSGLGNHLVNEPAQKINAGPVVNADRQMKRGFGQRLCYVPPPARDVKNVSVRERSFPDWIKARLLGCAAVRGERKGARHAVDFPMLSPRDLKNKYIVIVKV